MNGRIDYCSRTKEIFSWHFLDLFNEFFIPIFITKLLEFEFTLIFLLV